MFGVIMPLCNRMFCCILGDISTLKSGWNMKKSFCCPALELFHCLPPLFCCLPMWKTVRLHGKKLQNATKCFIWTQILIEQTKIFVLSTCIVLRILYVSATSLKAGTTLGPWLLQTSIVWFPLIVQFQKSARYICLMSEGLSMS